LSALVGRIISSSGCADRLITINDGPQSHRVQFRCNGFEAAAGVTVQDDRLLIALRRTRATLCFMIYFKIRWSL
jgi:hypothetical protein